MGVTAYQSKISCKQDEDMFSVVQLMQSWEEFYHCIGSKVQLRILHIVVQRVAGKGRRAV